jgi:hypothetical protein
MTIRGVGYNVEDDVPGEIDGDILGIEEGFIDDSMVGWKLGEIDGDILGIEEGFIVDSMVG